MKLNIFVVTFSVKQLEEVISALNMYKEKLTLNKVVKQRRTK